MKTMRIYLVASLAFFCLHSAAHAQQPTETQMEANKTLSDLSVKLKRSGAERKAAQGERSALEQIQSQANLYESMAEKFYVYSVMLDDQNPSQAALKEKLKSIYDLQEAEKAEELRRQLALIQAEKSLSFGSTSQPVINLASSVTDEGAQESGPKLSDDEARENEELRARIRADAQQQKEDQLALLGLIDLTDDRVVFILLGTPGHTNSRVSLKLDEGPAVTLAEGEQYQTEGKQTFKLVSVVLDESTTEVVANILIDGHELRSFRDQFRPIDSRRK